MSKRSKRLPDPPFRKRTPQSHNNPSYRGKPRTRAEGQKKSQEVQQIKAELLQFARSDWGRQWVKNLLEYGRPYRMQRGVRYAQEKRVENISISSGTIFATVQGTAPTPYRVKLSFDVISEGGWDNIVLDMASKARYVITLLENRMPSDLPEIFQAHLHTLYPPSRTIKATCSCPDKAVPCKHIAATILYIARVIDLDPFLLLQLRGKSKEELLYELQKQRSCNNQPVVQSFNYLRNLMPDAKGGFHLPTLSVGDLDLGHFLNGDDLQMAFHFPKPTTTTTSGTVLRSMSNLEDPDSFEIIFQDLYRNVQSTMFKTAQTIDKGQKAKKGGQKR